MVGDRGNSEMARSEKVVVDASVLVKWYNLGDVSEEALKLRPDRVDGALHYRV